jgi:3alpha(or 20beta)-hydroxysteroid dehydrogenase
VGLVEGKLVVVTGASRGIGQATARLLCAEGAQVVVTDVLEDMGRATVAELGARAEFVGHDVSSEDEWAQLVEHVLARHGRIDALVNNAGVSLTRPFLDTTLDEYVRLVSVNQVGVFLGMRTVGAVMARAGSGTIVNISSTSGMRGMANGLAYCATKWAVRGMTKAAALELAPLGIRVNSIHPGVTDTLFSGEMTAELRQRLTGTIPMGRMIAPDDIAGAVLFLVSDLCGCVTGAELLVDGGQLAGSFGVLRATDFQPAEPDR